MNEEMNYRRTGSAEFKMAVFRGNGDGRLKVFTHYHEEMEVFYLLKGELVLQVGKVTYTLTAGDVYFVLPDEVHGLRSFSPDARLRQIIFHKDAITMNPEHFFQKEFVKPLWEGKLRMPRYIKPDHSAYRDLLRCFEDLDGCRIFEPNYKGKRLALLVSMCTALLPCCQIMEGQERTPDPGNEAIKLSLRYLHNYYQEKVTLEKLANAVHLHPNYLCALFKEHTGERIFEYLTRIRIDSAAAILRKENVPVSKLAEKTGFTSESLFYQKFKQLMGVSPKTYRRMLEESDESLEEIEKK